MIHALNLDENNRILSTTWDKYAPEDRPRVYDEYMPVNEDGTRADVRDYLYVDGKFIYDPLPKTEDYSARIDELKWNLQDTMDDVLKIVEGATTLAECSEIIKKRAQWRNEIKELERKIAEAVATE